MFIWAYCLITVSLCKLVIDLLNPDLFATFSLVLDNVVFVVLFTLILRITFLQKQGKREQLKEKLSRLEKNISEIHEE
jgi:L-cystine uptake protein TcyP (sodium:dicarboxylate symporter family)